jgi:hypothetical protein
MSLFKLFIVCQLIVITELWNIETGLYFLTFYHFFDALEIFFGRLFLAYLDVLDGTFKNTIKLQIEVLFTIVVDDKLLGFFLLLLFYELIAG